MTIHSEGINPTDAEREALTYLITAFRFHERGLRGVAMEPDLAVSRPLAEFLLAEGFRRSEVPEPSAEEWAVRIAAVREKAIAKGYTPEHDAKHGVRHLLRWAIDYSRRGRAEDSSGLVAAAIDLADIAYAELERLRHVADTMRAVAEALRTRYANDSQAAYFMREIDAALEAAPEPQGEPSDAKVEAAARRLFGATVDSMDRARELARVALTAPPLVACTHWAPGKITFRNGCTACAADASGGVR